MARQEEDIVAKTNIISDYKTICSQLSQRIENLQTLHKEEIEAVKKVCGDVKQMLSFKRKFNVCDGNVV